MSASCRGERERETRPDATACKAPGCVAFVARGNRRMRFGMIQSLPTATDDRFQLSRQRGKQQIDNDNAISEKTYKNCWIVYGESDEENLINVGHGFGKQVFQIKHVASA